jgi:hypothetical protein
VSASGGGGTPLSILFKILGVEEATAKLKTINPELTKIQSTADQTGTKIQQAFSKIAPDTIKIKQVSTDLDKIKASAGNAQQGTDKFSVSLN